MDYSKMSDAEIGRRVADASKLDGGADYNGPTLILKNGVWTTFDPCNNPADAWSIIMKNNITIINDKDCYPRATNDSYTFIHEQFDDCIHALDRNPLRAAMIVFLMIQDAK